jgi:hypothetical protein
VAEDRGQGKYQRSITVAVRYKKNKKKNKKKKRRRRPYYGAII